MRPMRYTGGDRLVINVLDHTIASVERCVIGCRLSTVALRTGPGLYLLCTAYGELQA